MNDDKHEDEPCLDWVNDDKDEDPNVCWLPCAIASDAGNRAMCGPQPATCSHRAKQFTDCTSTIATIQRRFALRGSSSPLPQNMMNVTSSSKLFWVLTKEIISLSTMPLNPMSAATEMEVIDLLKSDRFAYIYKQSRNASVDRMFDYD